MLVVLLAQTLSLICAPRHFELAPSSFAGAVDVMQAGLPHEVDGTDACCASDIASGDALSTPIASPLPSGSYMLPLAGVFLLAAAAVAAPWTVPPLASCLPRLRRYYARSSRILG
jgi:hypothetical protein